MATKQPTLVTAWDKQAAALAEKASAQGVHCRPDGPMEACRHNALLLVRHVEQAFRDAGYFPMMLLLGTVVQPVIESGRACEQCLLNEASDIATPLASALEQVYPPHTQDDDCLACGGNVCEYAS